MYLDHLQQHQKRIRTSFIKCRAAVVVAVAAAVAGAAAVVVVVAVAAAVVAAVVFLKRFFTPTFRRDFSFN